MALISKINSKVLTCYSSFLLLKEPLIDNQFHKNLFSRAPQKQPIKSLHPQMSTAKPISIKVLSVLREQNSHNNHLRSNKQNNLSNLQKKLKRKLSNLDLLNYLTSCTKSLKTWLTNINRILITLYHLILFRISPASSLRCYLHSKIRQKITKGSKFLLFRSNKKCLLLVVSSLLSNKSSSKFLNFCRTLQTYSPSNPL